MSDHAHGSNADDAGVLTRNLQALNDEEKRLLLESEQLEGQKQAVVDAARQKAALVLEKARQKAESEREKILASVQADVDAQREALLKTADKEASALKKKKLNLTSKLLPLVFP